VEQDLHNFEVAIKWYQRCLEIPPPPPRVLNLEYYTWNPTRRIAECYQAMGNQKLALEWAQKVKDLLPTDADTLRWVESLTAKVKVELKGGLKVLEVGTKLRSDSTQIETVSAVSLEAESLDGLVTKSSPKAFIKYVKPGGFVWIATKDMGDLLDIGGVQLLGMAKYNGAEVWNYVKPYPDKPYLRIAQGDLQFGPYRIRQRNLELSAVKAGFNVTIGNVLEPGEDPDDADYYISPTLSRTDRGKVKILDLCEELPREMYDFKGIGLADLVTVCTENLQKHVQKLYPQKKVVVLEDHFEMTSEEWL
jgi:tetratricopeptide (TPR) repeat protein